MAGLGIKKLTGENWLDPDPIMSAFVRVSLRDGSQSPISADEWAARFLKPQLTAAVPDEILKLFEVARGSIAYGCFYYPLFTLAAEQLPRVAESAVSVKCALKGAPRKKTRTFQQKLFFLRDINIISKREFEDWNALREWRNHASHPASQTIMMPKDALSLLVWVAGKINTLFA